MVIVAIREESPDDIEAIAALNRHAFAGESEADLVNKLRAARVLTLSLVAVDGDQVVGHIAFSPVTVECETRKIGAIGLGPMAVTPQRQREGIGSQLVEAGLEALKKTGHNLVFVIGHPGYYPRFGFMPCAKCNIRCEYDVPEEAFMVKELREGALKGVQGIVRYRQEFHEV